mgnify:CR=1 FL=1
MAEDIQIQKMDGKSLDVTGVNKEKLKTVFPECFTEGNLDIDKLLSLCGEYIDNDFDNYSTLIDIIDCNIPLNVGAFSYTVNVNMKEALVN